MVTLASSQCPVTCTQILKQASNITVYSKSRKADLHQGMAPLVYLLLKLQFFLVVNVEPGQNVILRHTACWIATGLSLPKVDILIKIWRGASITGTHMASADDSADVERGT